MTTAAAAIVKALNEVFAPLDAKVLAETHVWAAGRVAALREYKASDEYKTDSRKPGGSYIVYPKMYDICGGKSWFQVFNGAGEAGLRAFIIKNHEATVARRNAMIARKLDKAGVTEVVSSEFAHSNDGFHGSFGVMTAEGGKVVTVQTIFAGGYNIQCLHMRTLCNVR